MAPPAGKSVIIAGAGIAGLTAALAFARRGFEVTVIERAIALAEVGAGIQLSPNATRLLGRLGVLDILSPRATRVEAVVLKSTRSLRRLATVPLGDAERRWGAPYLVIHRGDLQAALLEAVRAQPRIVLELGMTVTGGRDDGDTFVLLCERDGAPSEHSAGLVIGADGVWSTLRQAIGGPAGRRTPYTAWRTTVQRSSRAGMEVEKIASSNEVTTFLAPRLHLVVYPVHSGTAYNLVAAARGEMVAEHWSNTSDGVWLGWVMAGMRDPLPGLAEIAAPWLAWPIFEVPAGAIWRRGRLVLIGDAAHAITPFAAQGSAMAIEDAAVLARLVAEGGSDMEGALSRYEALRRPRISNVAMRGAFNNFTWHAWGPFEIGRNVVLKALPGSSLLPMFDGLYGYDAEAA